MDRSAPDAPADDDPVQRDAARRERRYLALIGGIFVVTAIIGVGVGAIVSTDVDGAFLLIVGGVVLGALLLTGLGTFLFARWRRRRGSAMFARSPLYELPTMRQRSAFLKAIRRGRPIPPEQHALAVRVARDLSRRTGLIWIFVLVGVAQVVNIVVQDGWLQYLYVVNTALFLGLAAYWAWLVRVMRVRLRELESAESRPAESGS